MRFANISSRNKIPLYGTKTCNDHVTQNGNEYTGKAQETRIIASCQVSSCIHRNVIKVISFHKL